MQYVRSVPRPTGSSKGSVQIRKEQAEISLYDPENHEEGGKVGERGNDEDAYALVNSVLVEI